MDNLIKIKDVSAKYDITARTLRYYEDMGLITSIRSSDYAYRMYDETAVNRLEQILILRKLNISIKDIQLVFSASSSSAVLGVLEKKVQYIDDEVALLHELKDIVLDFIREIQRVNFANNSDIKQLYDKAKEIETQLVSVDYIGKPSKGMLKNVKSVRTTGSFPTENALSGGAQHTFLELFNKPSNINRLLEITDKLDKKIPDVMVVKIPNFRAITSAGHKRWDSLMGWAWEDSRRERLFKDVIFDCPDFLVRKHNEKGEHYFEYVMAVRDDVTDAGPFNIINFEGGLYALSVSIDGDHESINKVEDKIVKWLEGTNFEYDENRSVMGSMGFLYDEIKQGLGYNQLHRYVPIKLSKDKIKAK